MRDLESSLPLSRLSDALELPETVIDALVESGRILCRIHEGEILVPLAQVESLLRDAMLRLYAAEALAKTTNADECVLSPPPHADSTDRIAAPEPMNAPSADEVAHASDAPTPAPEAVPVQPAPAPSAVAVPAEVWRFAEEAEVEEEAPPDLRRATRYVPLRQLTGMFAVAKFTVLQLSATGLRIRHTEPLLPGDEAKLTFALLRPARSVVVRARVVWTSVARIGDEQFSISGLRVIEHADRLEKAIETMKAAHELQPERRASVRRANDAVAMLREVSDEEMALVTSALHKFAADPVEASRWYSRGRFALSDEHVREIAPQRGREREEALGVWEYLDRQVDLEKVAGVMKWVRG